MLTDFCDFVSDLGGSFKDMCIAGAIPATWADMNWEYVSLVNNQLSGHLPGWRAGNMTHLDLRIIFF